MTDCEKCNEGDMGGHNGDEIEVDGKYFCPVTFQQIWLQDELDEMSEEEIEKPGLKIELVRPALYRIVKSK